MFSVYLCGYINERKIEECRKWRQQIASYFYTNPKWQDKISFLDPMNGEVGTITNKGLKCKLPGKALVHRDYNSVKTASVIIANLDTFGEQRPLIGSVYELAWAWQMKKPVIVITKDKNYKYHPFIEDTASIIVSSVEEMLSKRILVYLYKGQVSASY